MSFENPNKLDRFMDKLNMSLFGKKIYGTFVEKANLSGNENILDFGCGTGGTSQWILPKLKTGTILALDISKPRLEVAKEKLAGNSIEFTSTPIEKLNNNTKLFDKIFIHYMLHDIPAEDRPETVQNLANFLAADGELIIREPTRKSHGMPSEEIDALFIDAGLDKINSEIGRMFLIIPYYFAIFKKTEKEQ